MEGSKTTNTTETIVKGNKFSDVVTVIKVEVKKISLLVQNKWLVPDGLVMPNKTSLYVVAHRCQTQIRQN